MLKTKLNLDLEKLDFFAATTGGPSFPFPTPDMGRPLAMTLTYLAYWLATTVSPERQKHHLQHGSCSYTFILPEVDCHPQEDISNTLQRDSPLSANIDELRMEKEGSSWEKRKLESLESAMENNTQWLQKLESFIQENVLTGMEEMKRSAMSSQTAAVLEMGTNLLSRSAEQTHKLMDVETQMLNQTSRLEIQLLEYTLFTNRLEKLLFLQTQELSRLSDKNHFLEERLLALEARYGREVQSLQNEKQRLQELLVRQSGLVSELQGEMGPSTHNSSLQQRQQDLLMHIMHQLLAMVSHCHEMSHKPKEEPPRFKDCAEILQSGVTKSGVYSIHLHNSTQTVKVFCDMETLGGGWTVFQHRRNGSVEFHQNWKNYKMGFGDVSGEHWLGNDIIHRLTTSQEYSLYVQLRDREGNEAYSQYDLFYIHGEEKNYRKL